ncbi:MAG: hypothetical protein ACLT63_00375 [Bacteroides xylanisolvens]
MPKKRIWLKAVQTSDMYICSSAYQLLYEIEDQSSGTAVKYAEYYIQCKDSLDKQISVSSTIHALGQNMKKNLKWENQQLQNEQLRKRMYYLILSISCCW